MGHWKPYTDHEKQTVRDHWKSKTDAQIAIILSCSKHRVTNCRHKLGLKKGTGRGCHPNAWSEQEDQILQQHYANTPVDKLKELLPGRSRSGIYGRAHKLDLDKDEQYIADMQSANGHRLQEQGKGNRFEKGHTPANKGMKQEEYMSPEAIAKTKVTRFKKGDMPANAKWDGAVSIRHAHEERGEPPYLWIRISKGNWVLYHRHRWEQEVGPIPDKHVLRCTTSNTLDPRPENWECISMAENARRNSNWEKAQQTMKKQGNRAAVDLTDPWVASMVAGHDEDIKEHLLNDRPDIIRAARANYKLKRSINDASKET